MGEKIPLSNGQELEPTPLHHDITFINGLDEDAVNQFVGIDANIQLIKHPEHTEDIEENKRLLRRRLVSYREYFAKRGDEYINRAKESPESSEASIALYDQLVLEYNQVAAIEEIDTEKLLDILRRAYALFNRKSNNLA